MNFYSKNLKRIKPKSKQYEKKKSKVFYFANLFFFVVEKFGFSCCSRLKDKKVEDLDIAKWACWNCISLNQPYLQKCEICKQPKFIQVTQNFYYIFLQRRTLEIGVRFSGYFFPKIFHLL